MDNLLPSEIARLVLGYVKNEGCMDTYYTFLRESPHLAEYARLFDAGQEYSTNVGGLSLKDRLRDNPGSSAQDSATIRSDVKAPQTGQSSSDAGQMLHSAYSVSRRPAASSASSYQARGHRRHGSVKSRSSHNIAQIDHDNDADVSDAQSSPSATSSPISAPDAWLPNSSGYHSSSHTASTHSIRHHYRRHTQSKTVVSHSMSRDTNSPDVSPVSLNPAALSADSTPVIPIVSRMRRSDLLSYTFPSGGSSNNNKGRGRGGISRPKKSTSTLSARQKQLAIHALRTGEILLESELGGDDPVADKDIHSEGAVVEIRDYDVPFTVTHLSSTPLEHASNEQQYGASILIGNQETTLPPPIQQGACDQKSEEPQSENPAELSFIDFDSGIPLTPKKGRPLSPASSCLTTPMKTPRKNSLGLDLKGLFKSPRRKSQAPKRRSFGPSPSSVPVVKPEAASAVFQPQADLCNSNDSTATQPFVCMPLLCQEMVNSMQFAEVLADNINKGVEKKPKLTPAAESQSEQEKPVSSCAAADTNATEAGMQVTETSNESLDGSLTRSMPSASDVLDHILEESQMSAETISGIIQMTKNDPTFDGLFNIFKADKNDSRDVMEDGAQLTTATSSLTTSSIAGFSGEADFPPPTSTACATAAVNSPGNSSTTPCQPHPDPVQIYHPGSDGQESFLETVHIVSTADQASTSTGANNSAYLVTPVPAASVSDTQARSLDTNASGSRALSYSAVDDGQDLGLSVDAEPGEVKQEENVTLECSSGVTVTRDTARSPSPRLLAPKPVVVQTLTNQPLLGQSMVGQPLIAQPSVVGQTSMAARTVVSVAQPMIAQPAVGQPFVAQSAIGQPGVAQSAIGQPGVAQSVMTSASGATFFLPPGLTIAMPYGAGNMWPGQQFPQLLGNNIIGTSVPLLSTPLVQQTWKLGTKSTKRGSRKTATTTSSKKCATPVSSPGLCRPLVIASPSPDKGTAVTPQVVSILTPVKSTPASFSTLSTSFASLLSTPVKTQISTVSKASVKSPISSVKAKEKAATWGKQAQKKKLTELTVVGMELDDQNCAESTETSSSASPQKQGDKSSKVVLQNPISLWDTPILSPAVAKTPQKTTSAIPPKTSQTVPTAPTSTDAKSKKARVRAPRCAKLPAKKKKDLGIPAKRISTSPEEKSQASSCSTTNAKSQKTADPVETSRMVTRQQTFRSKVLLNLDNMTALGRPAVPAKGSPRQKRLNLGVPDKYVSPVKVPAAAKSPLQCFPTVTAQTLDHADSSDESTVRPLSVEKPRIRCAYKPGASEPSPGNSKPKIFTPPGTVTQIPPSTGEHTPGSSTPTGTKHVRNLSFEDRCRRNGAGSSPKLNDSAPFSPVGPNVLVISQNKSPKTTMIVTQSDKENLLERFEAMTQAEDDDINMDGVQPLGGSETEEKSAEPQLLSMPLLGISPEKQPGFRISQPSSSPATKITAITPNKPGPCVPQPDADNQSVPATETILDNAMDCGDIPDVNFNTVEPQGCEDCGTEPGSKSKKKKHKRYDSEDTFTCARTSGLRDNHKKKKKHRRSKSLDVGSSMEDSTTGSPDAAAPSRSHCMKAAAATSSAGEQTSSECGAVEKLLSSKESIPESSSASNIDEQLPSDPGKEASKDVIEQSSASQTESPRQESTTSTSAEVSSEIVDKLPPVLCGQTHRRAVKIPKHVSFGLIDLVAPQPKTDSVIAIEDNPLANETTPSGPHSQSGSTTPGSTANETAPSGPSSQSASTTPGPAANGMSPSGPNSQSGSTTPGPAANQSSPSQPSESKKASAGGKLSLHIPSLNVDQNREAEVAEALVCLAEKAVITPQKEQAPLVSFTNMAPQQVVPLPPIQSLYADLVARRQSPSEALGTTKSSLMDLVPAKSLLDIPGAPHSNDSTWSDASSCQSPGGTTTKKKKPRRIVPIQIESYGKQRSPMTLSKPVDSPLQERGKLAVGKEQQVPRTEGQVKANATETKPVESLSQGNIVKTTEDNTSDPTKQVTVEQSQTSAQSATVAEKDSKQETAAPPAGKDSKQETAAPPAGKDSKQETVAPSAEKDSKQETAAPPVGKDSKQDTVAPPAGKDSKQETVAPPAGKDSKQEMVAPPAEKDSKRETVAPPAEKDSKREMVAPPAGKDSKQETVAPPAGKDSKMETVVPPAGKDSKLETVALPVGKDSKQETVAPPADSPQRPSSSANQELPSTSVMKTPTKQQSLSSPRKKALIASPVRSNPLNKLLQTIVSHSPKKGTKRPAESTPAEEKPKKKSRQAKDKSVNPLAFMDVEKFLAKLHAKKKK